MVRAVDPKHARKAKRALNALKVQVAPEDGEGSPFSPWEQAFIAGVSTRLDTFGSAFADFSKGAPDHALSRLQEQKIKELAKKARVAQRAAARDPTTDTQVPRRYSSFSRKPKKA